MWPHSWLLHTQSQIQLYSDMEVNDTSTLNMYSHPTIYLPSNEKSIHCECTGSVNYACHMDLACIWKGGKRHSCTKRHGCASCHLTGERSTWMWGYLMSGNCSWMVINGSFHTDVCSMCSRKGILTWPHHWAVIVTAPGNHSSLWGRGASDIITTREKTLQDKKSALQTDILVMTKYWIICAHCLQLRAIVQAAWSFEH